VFGVPFSVQPLKALTAVAVAERLSPDVIHAAGLEIGLFLLLLSVGRVADLLARLFTTPVVRALQLGVGVLLVIAAVRLVADPPAVFLGAPEPPWPLLLAAASFVAVGLAAARGRYPVALVLLVAGVAVTWLTAHAELSGPSFALPEVGLPPVAAFGSAFVLLVIPSSRSRSATPWSRSPTWPGVRSDQPPGGSPPPRSASRAAWGTCWPG
jgi:hypothetical protein